MVLRKLNILDNYILLYLQDSRSNNRVDRKMIFEEYRTQSGTRWWCWLAIELRISAQYQMIGNDVTLHLHICTEVIRIYEFYQISNNVNHRSKLLGTSFERNFIFILPLYILWFLFERYHY